MLSTIAEIQKGQGLGSGYIILWLAGLISFQGLYGRVSLQDLHQHTYGPWPRNANMLMSIEPYWAYNIILCDFLVSFCL